jgi:ubiquinone/menaquinone biosynthesis C-methylase UbiE
MTYDRQQVSQYFDAFGEREWQRLETTLQGRSNHAVHKHLLRGYVQPGCDLLDVGSGPGRFAIDAVTMGARVTLADISQVQLDLAQRRLAEQAMLDKVGGFHVADVIDLSMFRDASFDLVVAFGGVISYTRDRYDAALREIARVLRPGGAALVSVMSLHGVMRLIGPLDAPNVLESIDQHLDWSAMLAGADTMLTRAGSTEFHQPLVLFTSNGLRSALTDAGLVVERIACANPLFPQFMRVPKMEASALASDRLIELEVAVCEQPGLADAGGHLIAAARRRSANDQNGALR